MHALEVCHVAGFVSSFSVFSLLSHGRGIGITADACQMVSLVFFTKAPLFRVQALGWM